MGTVSTLIHPQFALSVLNTHSFTQLTQPSLPVSRTSSLIDTIARKAKFITTSAVITADCVLCYSGSQTSVISDLQAHRSIAMAAYSAAALLCTCALLSGFTHAQCGGFALSCNGIGVSAQGELTAICSDGNGGFDRAALDLNQYINNSNGNLVDGAGFAASCQNIRWFQLGTNDEGVAAECTLDDGTTDSTNTYNVEARVSNNGGILVFNSCCCRALLDTSAITGRKMLHL